MWSLFFANYSSGQDGVDALLRLREKLFSKHPEGDKYKFTREEFLKAVKDWTKKNPLKPGRAQQELKQLLEEFVVPKPCVFYVEKEWIIDKTKYTGWRIIFSVGAPNRSHARIPIKQMVESKRKLMADEIKK